MDAPVVEGYGTCLCGGLHPIIALSRSAGTCPDCEHVLFEQVERLEVMEEGRRLVVPIVRRRRRSTKQQSRATRAAREAAMRRLKNIDHEIFALLYAQERSKRGLESFPIEGRALSIEGVQAALRSREN